MYSKVNYGLQESPTMLENPDLIYGDFRYNGLLFKSKKDPKF